MSKILIIGAGGHGRVILDILSHLYSFEVMGFLDDDPGVKGKYIDGKPVLGSTADSIKVRSQSGADSAVIAIGNNAIRAAIFERFENEGFEMPFIIHPQAIISRNAKMGNGVIIMPGVTVNTGARIGRNVCINTGATVDHDCVIDDHAHIYPGANLAGGVHIGRLSYVGTNAAINPYISIGENSFIGSGAAVVEDMPADVVAVGVPAKVIKNKNRRM